MLLRLYLKNYKLVDELVFEPGEGLNIITGETGAGKTILIDAINILLGARIEGDVLRKGKDTFIIEGSFSINRSLKTMIESSGIPVEDKIIIRRIEKNGKRGNYVNDMSVSVHFLKTIGSHLIDIHGQHKHVELLTPSKHISYLDSSGNYYDDILHMKTYFKNYSELLKDLNELGKKEKEFEEKKDFLLYKKSEIEKLALKDNEYKELLKEQKLLESAHKRQNLCHGIISHLSESEDNVNIHLEAIKKNIIDLAVFDNTFNPIKEMIHETESILEEIWRETSDYMANIEVDDIRLEKINERLFNIENVANKYHVEPNELKVLLNEINEELNNIENISQQKETIEKKLEEIKKEMDTTADTLSKKRKKIIPLIEKEITKVLKELGMEKARFIIQIKPTEISEKGIDNITFLFSANPDADPQPINKVASGGELSRIMLALKSILKKDDDVETMIFDEIDSGVSGRIGEAVGKRLSSLGEKKQIIAITHLAQIAKQAKNHFLVEKKFIGEHTFTSIKLLEKRERINEIARLMSGEKITDSVIKHVEEILNEK